MWHLVGINGKYPVQICLQNKTTPCLFKLDKGLTVDGLYFGTRPLHDEDPPLQLKKHGTKKSGSNASRTSTDFLGFFLSGEVTGERKDHGRDFFGGKITAGLVSSASR